MGFLSFPVESPYALLFDIDEDGGIGGGENIG